MSIHSLSSQHSLRGFVLLPVVIAITLIATIAFLMNREGAMNVNTLGGEIETTEALYAAKAGLNHMLWKMEQSGCSGYSDIGPTAFGTNSYSVTVAPTSGSPVSISATGMHPSGARYTIKRDGVNVGGPTQTKVNQPHAAIAQDTYISYLNPTTNYGTTSTLAVSQRSGNNQRGLLQFDVSGFSSSATIMSADLSLYQYTGSSLGGPISVHRVLGGIWSETAATWNNRNSGLPWTSAGGEYDASAVAVVTLSSGAVGWVSLNITSLLQSWISGTYPNNGLILLPDTASSDAYFYSSDAGITYIPKMTVTYTCPCGITCYTATPVTVTLNPVADSLVDSQNTNKNYGALSSLKIKYNSSLIQKRTLLKFNTSAISAGTLILSAKLRLDVTSLLTPSSNPKTVSAYALTESWLEGSKSGTGPADGVTWNTSNGSVAWNTLGGSYQTPSVAMAVEETSGISPPPGNFTTGWLDWDLKALTQEWVDGVTANNGVILISTVPDELIIDSKEKGGSTIPQLVITFPQ